MTNMFKEKAKNYPEPKPAFMQTQIKINFEPTGVKVINKDK